LGVPICKTSYMFGDNKSIVDSVALPHAKLHRRHNALSFHHVWEAVAAKIVLPYYLPGGLNPSDILTKHWGYASIWCMLPVLFWWHLKSSWSWRLVCFVLTQDCKSMGSDKFHKGMASWLLWSVCRTLITSLCPFMGYTSSHGYFSVLIS
jgi:hypothetical protein